MSLSEADVLATGASIARAQEPSGAIAWPDGHVDAWDHVECAMALYACGLREPARRAYGWLRATQRADGSWPRSTVGGTVTDPAAESHHAAYVAVGAWHEYLVTGDEGQALTMWPTVCRAVEWALGLRTGRGEVAWERDAGGTAGTYALLSGCSSIHQGLRCAVALAKLARAGLCVGWHHHAHGLHAPYWWLKCAVGVHNDKHPLASAYHRMLVWDITNRPAVTRVAERALNPVVGKSLVVYAVKPERRQ